MFRRPAKSDNSLDIKPKLYERYVDTYQQALLENAAPLTAEDLGMRAALHDAAFMAPLLRRQEAQQNRRYPSMFHIKLYLVAPGSYPPEVRAKPPQTRSEVFAEHLAERGIAERVIGHDGSTLYQLEATRRQQAQLEQPRLPS